MSNYGFANTKKVNGKLYMEELNNDIPSIVWSQIVDAQNNFFASVPELRGLNNARILSVPLDYNYSDGHPANFSVGTGNTNTYVDASRYYTCPQPHDAVYYPASGQVSITKSNGTIDDIEQLYYDFGVLVEEGTYLDIDYLLSIGVDPNYYITGGSYRQENGYYISNDLYIDFAKIVAVGNISVVLSLGVRPNVPSAYDAFDRWLYIMLCDTDVNASNGRAGNYTLSSGVQAGFEEIKNGLYEKFKTVDAKTCRPGIVQGNDGGTLNVYPSYATSYQQFIWTSAVTVNRAHYTCPKDLWEIDTRNGKLRRVSYYPSKISYVSSFTAPESIVYITPAWIANYKANPPTFFRPDVDHAFLDVGAVPVPHIEAEYNDFNQLYSAPLKFNAGNMQFCGKDIGELAAAYVPPSGFYFGGTTNSGPFSGINVANARCRSFVFVVADVTRDEVVQRGLDNSDYGFTDENRTINQYYSNLFLYEQQLVSPPGSLPYSYPGLPVNGGVARIYWDDPGAGAPSDHVLYDTIDIPLKSFISIGDPAVVVIHNDSNVDWAFVGFKRDSQRYTHASFFVPKWRGNLSFSVLSTAPQIGGEYFSTSNSFTDTHARINANSASTRGYIGGNSAALVTCTYTQKVSFFRAQGEQYGVLVKNKTGKTVFNSTAYHVDGTNLVPIDSVELFVQSGGALGRSNRYLNSGVISTTQPYMMAGIVGGTFNALDFGSNSAEWTKTQSDWFTKTKYYSSTQVVASFVPVCAMTPWKTVRIAYAPTWHWYIKYGGKETSLTTLGSFIGFIGAAVATYFGFYQAAIALASMQVSINTLFANLPGYQAPTMSNFTFDEGVGNVYKMNTKNILRLSDESDRV